MISSKTKKIVSLKLCSNKKTISNNANPSVIKDLEAMLKRAKNGQIKSFVAVELGMDHTVNDILSADWDQDCNSFIGMLADIQYMMLKHQNGG